MLIKYTANYDGMTEQDELYVDDTATDEEIEACVKEAVLNYVSWTWEEVESK